MKSLLTRISILFTYKVIHMKRIITIIVVALFAISASAMAQGSKIGFDYVMLNSEIEGVDFDTSAVQFRYIHGVAPNFDVEAFIALGLSDDSYSDTDPFLLGDFSPVESHLLCVKLFET